MWSDQTINKTALLFAIIVVIGAGFVWALVEKDDKAINFQVKHSCNLHTGPCQAVADSGETVEFSIIPTEIPLLKPLDLTVRLHSLKAEAVNIVFTGVDVDMGRIVYSLQSTDGIIYTGRASLSVCSRQKMTWQALVTIKTKNSEIGIPFRFGTIYHPNFIIL